MSVVSPLPAITEKQWQEQVIQLATLGGWAYYHPYDSRRSVSGWPDLVLCRPPELLIVELKNERGRVSPAQREWLDALRACGVEVYIWRPGDFDVVYERLKRRRHAA